MASGVQASRDGDRFHYVLVAHRLLQLLELDGPLTAVSVEEVPAAETGRGDDVVDFVEYYGGTGAASCEQYTYVQVKHSTLRVHQEMTASDLSKTLTGFKAKHVNAVSRGTASKLTFEFVSNRTLQEKVHQALTWLAGGRSGPSIGFKEPAKVLAKAAGFDVESNTDGSACAAFFSSLTINDGHIGLRRAEMVLRDDLAEYLPGSAGAEMRDLVERVARCATSLENHRLLQRADVLLVLRTSADEIFPAASVLEDPAGMLATQAIATAATTIVGSTGPAGGQKIDTGEHEPAGPAWPTTYLVTATGGTGKSVFSTLLGSMLPAESLTLIYDCFAAGDYRRATSFRHLPSVAFTQLSNELAQAGLCSPLVPLDGIAEDRYLRAFDARVRRAAATVAMRAPEALLCIVVDAGDNAAMAAQVRGHQTFVNDVLNIDWPPNVRMVVTCRPERADRLRIPSSVHQLALGAFTVEESTSHLRATFPEASEADGRELHELSSQGNPRVQTMALANAKTVEESLARLRVAAAGNGGAVGSDGTDATLGSLLQQQVDTMVDNDELTSADLGRLGRAAAVLPPAIPIDVLARTARLDVNAIRSFASSLGRGVHTSTHTFQFRDEPTETWFRTTFSPSTSQLADIIAELKIVSSSSAYAAQTLPQLLFEADLYDDLVELALSEKFLPVSPPTPHTPSALSTTRSGLQRPLSSASLRNTVHAGDGTDLQTRQVARSRTKYALSALLRLGRFGDAALLAVQAGRLSGGHRRRMTMFRANPDLTARFVEADVVAEMCASKEFASDWVGSHLHVEAAVLSGNPDTRPLARSRTRTAFENFVALANAPREEDRAHLGKHDAAALAWAYLNIDGPSATVAYMRRWRSGQFRRSFARVLFARLADAGRFDDINDIVRTRRSGLYLHVAAAEVLFDYGRPLPDDITVKLVGKLARRNKSLLPTSEWRSTRDGRGVTWALLHALNIGAVNDTDALRILGLHAPPLLSHSVGPNRSESSTIVGELLTLALRTYLRREPFTFDTIAPPNIVKQLKDSHGRDSYANEYSDFVSPLLTWVQHLLELNLTAAREGLKSTAIVEQSHDAIDDLPTGESSHPDSKTAEAGTLTDSPQAGRAESAVAESALTLAAMMKMLPRVDGGADNALRGAEGKHAWHGPLTEAVTRILIAADALVVTAEHEGENEAEDGDDTAGETGQVPNSSEVAAARTTFTQWYSSFAKRGPRDFNTHVEIARIAGRHEPLAGLGLRAVAHAADAAAVGRTQSESRVERLIRVARAALALNPDEARALFTQAVEQADRVGDDLAERTNALLTTAATIEPRAVVPSDATSSVTSEAGRAYRLFQIAEALHQEGEGIHLPTVAARMWHLDHALALAATSRARDRRTLTFTDMTIAPFTAGATTAHDRGLLALRAFNPDTAWRELASTAEQQQTTDNADQQPDVLTTGTSSSAPEQLRRATPDGWDERTWRHTVETLDDFERSSRYHATERVTPIMWSDRLVNLVPPQGDHAATATATSPPDAAPETPRRCYGDDQDGPVDVEELCASLDFTLPTSWDTALTKPWRLDRPDAVVGIAFDKHELDRPKLLEALAHAPQADMDDFVRAAEAARSAPQTPALRAARTAFASRFVSRFALRLCTTQYLARKVTAFATASEVDAADIMQAAVEELAGVAHDLEYGDYFSLAATLAALLDNTDDTPAEGLTIAGSADRSDTKASPTPSDIFDALTSLFDELAPPLTTSDGPYRPVTTQPAATGSGPRDLADHSGNLASVPEALAGLVWSALGDPEVTIRWQAVHAVLLLARLGCHSELATIADLCSGQADATGSFTDSRFDFYELHARMWLLYALIRISHDEDHADAAAPFGAWLVQVALGPAHAVHQHLAHTIVSAMVARGLLTSDTGRGQPTAQPADQQDPRTTHTTTSTAHAIGGDGARTRAAYAAASDLEAVAQLRLQPRALRVEWQKRNAVPRALPPPPEDSDRLSIEWDFDRYWCEQISRMFPVGNDAVLWRVIQLIRAEHGPDATKSYEDPRRAADVYEGRRAYLDHSSWPQTDNVRFYRSFHALMQVAAELRDTAAVFHGMWGDDDEQDEWAQWLAHFLPHRSDGRFLADRRDRPPSPSPLAHLPEHDDKTWPWSLCPEAFADALGASSAWTVVWESSSAATGSNDEDRAIRTALVPHDAAPDLLAAMQTSPTGFRAINLPSEGDVHHDDVELLIPDEPPHDETISEPTYESDTSTTDVATSESSHGPAGTRADAAVGCDGRRDPLQGWVCAGWASRRGPFQLAPFIRDIEREVAIERHDENGASVPFPPPGPAQRIIDQFNLTCDTDQRRWYHDGHCVIRTTVWQNMTSYGSDRETGTNGKRVEIDNDFLSAVLSHLDRSLVAEVGLRRTQYLHYRERNKDVEFDYLDWSAKAYLIGPDGHWTEY